MDGNCSSVFEKLQVSRLLEREGRGEGGGGEKEERRREVEGVVKIK